MFVQRIGPSGEPEWVVVDEEDDDDGSGKKRRLKQKGPQGEKEKLTRKLIFNALSSLFHLDTSTSFSNSKTY